MLTIQELLDIIIMSLAVGYIFMDMFVIKRLNYAYPQKASFDWHALLFSALITAPGIIVHELAHKFVAILLGLSATFHAHYQFLMIGIALKLMNFPFIFFVPGYVEIPYMYIHPLVNSLIAFSGPAFNGLLYLGAKFALSQNKYSQRTTMILFFTQKINGLLFVFNMLPIPGFDGWQVYAGLLRFFL